MIYVGIDWSSQYDDVCIVNETEEKVKEFRIKINKEGFEQLLEVLNFYAPDKSKIVIGIETDKNILADFLQAHGYIVCNLNPLKVNRFKERYSVCAKKDDKFDAYSIALFLLKDLHNFKPIVLPSQKCESLRLHSRTLDRLTRERTRLCNYLRSDLMAYFPAFLAFFDDLTSNVTMNVLKACSSPSQFNDISEAQFIEKMNEIKYFHKKRKSKLYEHLESEIILFSSIREEAMASGALILVDQILDINTKIKLIKVEITEINASHKLAPVFASLPGAGEILAPKLLALLGDNKERFESYQSIQCYAGTAPVTERSGKSFYNVKMRRACNKSFRDALYNFAFCSLSLEEWAGDYYKQLRKKKYSHSRAIRALSNKWAKIIFRMWKDEKIYDRNIFVNKREKYLAA